MRILWTLFKVCLGLAVAIPVGLFILALTAGVVGTLVGLAFWALRLAIIGFVAYGTFLLAKRLFWPAPATTARRLHELPAPDPYYDAAMRELDAELGRK